MRKKPFKTSEKQERDRGRDSQLRPRPRLNSQPQGPTKGAVSDEGVCSGGHMARLPLGKVHRSTSKDFCAFLEVHFCLVLLCFCGQENFQEVPSQAVP